jgi:hypothetical protein
VRSQKDRGLTPQASAPAVAERAQSTAFREHSGTLAQTTFHPRGVRLTRLRVGVAAVNELQDQFQFSAGSSEPFSSPDYDEASLNATRQALLELARGLNGFDHAFGTKEAVDPIRHLIGSAAGWGGLPDEEAFYNNVDPGLPVGEYQLTVFPAHWRMSPILC